MRSCLPSWNGTTEPAAGQHPAWGGEMAASFQDRLFCPHSVGIPPGLTIVPSPNLPMGIPAVATSWELEWNGPPVAGCQSRPSWCRGKRRIRLPTPRPVKASDPVGSAVRRGGGRVPRAWGFAPDLTVTSQTSGSAHGEGPRASGAPGFAANTSSPDRLSLTRKPTLSTTLPRRNLSTGDRLRQATCNLQTKRALAFHSVLGSLQPADEGHFHPTRPPLPCTVYSYRPWYPVHVVGFRDLSSPSLSPSVRPQGSSVIPTPHPRFSSRLRIDHHRTYCEQSLWAPKPRPRGFNLTLVLTPLLGLDDGWAFARHSWIEPSEARQRPAHERTSRRTDDERAIAFQRKPGQFKSYGANADTPLIAGAAGF